MEIAKERPPFVRFETRSIEDRQASVDKGCYTGKDIDFAIITSPGSRDCVERIVDDWLVQVDGQAHEGRMPIEWARGFREHYVAWKAGKEAPLNGRSVADWPSIGPSTVKQLQDLKIRTVEDLAVANEEVIRRLGMGARELKQKAADWLKSTQDSGKLTEELTTLRAENETLRVRCGSLEEQLRAVVVQMEAASKPTKG